MCASPVRGWRVLVAHWVTVGIYAPVPSVLQQHVYVCAHISFVYICLFTCTAEQSAHAGNCWRAGNGVPPRTAPSMSASHIKPLPAHSAHAACSHARHKHVIRFAHTVFLIRRCGHTRRTFCEQATFDHLFLKAKFVNNLSQHEWALDGRN
jgi:hypothetical protein